MGNKRMTKQEFNLTVTQLLATHSILADRITAESESERYKQALAALEEYDPHLVKILREADESAVEGHTKIVKYLSSRVEN